MPFEDRFEAGRRLGAALAGWRGRDAVVLGLPRGGVIVARLVADALGAPLDVRVARKIGAPGQDEFAIGAVTARGTRVLHGAALRRMLLPPGWLDQATEAQRQAAEARERQLRGVRPAIDLHGRVAILVDDGVATGMTMRAAIADVRAERPAALVVAAPVMAPDTLAALRREADEVVALEAPTPFGAVGEFYRDFRPVPDEAVRAMLAAGVR